MPTTSQLVRNGRHPKTKKLATPGLKSGEGCKKKVAAPAPTPLSPGPPPAGPAPGTLPQPVARLSGTAKALRRRVKPAKVACANTATKVTCKVTFPGARNKRRVAATLKKGAATVAKGRVRRASGRGLVTITGSKPLQKGAYALSIRVGRTTYRFKVRLG